MRRDEQFASRYFTCYFPIQKPLMTLLIVTCLCVISPLENFLDVRNVSSH